MNREIRINLSTIGYDERYILYNNGHIIDQIKGANVDVNAEHEVRLLDITGKKQRIRLKTLYRKAFHKECKRTIVGTVIKLAAQKSGTYL